MLKKTKSENVYQNPYLGIDKHILQDANAKEFDYFTINTEDGVLVIPIKIKDDKVSFIMTKQFRVAANTECLEFPKGGMHYGEVPEDAARRELLEETGYKPEWIKLFYSFYSTSRSSNKCLVYLALITETEADRRPLTLDAMEEAAELSIVEFSADELLKLIKTNEIVDGQSLAALTTVLLQTGAAAQYLETLGG